MNVKLFHGLINKFDSLYEDGFICRMIDENLYEFYVYNGENWFYDTSTVLDVTEYIKDYLNLTPTNNFAYDLFTIKDNDINDFFSPNAYEISFKDVCTKTQIKYISEIYD